MGESKNMMETLSKMKIAGYAFILVGVALFFEGIADLTWTAYNLNDLTPYLSTAFYLIGDVVCIVAAILLWVVSVKILQAKS